MPENQTGTVHIGRLTLRIPGNRADTAHQVAHGVAEGLAQRGLPGMRRHLGALGVRVSAPAGATAPAISDVVAEAIIRALRK
jgi:hypothetical protein